MLRSLLVVYLGLGGMALLEEIDHRDLGFQKFTPDNSLPLFLTQGLDQDIRLQPEDCLSPSPHREDSKLAP